MLVGENMFRLWAVGTYVLHIATPPPCDSCQVAQVQSSTRSQAREAVPFLYYL